MPDSKKLLAEQVIENEVIRQILKKSVSAPVCLELMCQMTAKGLSERRLLTIVIRNLAAEIF